MTGGLALVVDVLVLGAACEYKGEDLKKRMGWKRAVDKKAVLKKGTVKGRREERRIELGVRWSM